MAHDEARKLHILVTHPYPPVSGNTARLRNEQLAALGERVRALNGRTILAGDFNAAPYSPHFRDLLGAASLRDAARGFGLRGTWPAQLPGLRIRIDHVLATESVVAIDHRIGPDVGSDHLSVVVDLSLE